MASLHGTSPESISIWFRPSIDWESLPALWVLFGEVHMAPDQGKHTVQLLHNFQHYRAGEHSLRSIVFNSGQDFSCQIYLPKYIFSLELVISNGTYSELISTVVIDEFDIDWAQAKIHTNGGTRVLTREYNLRRSPYSLKLSGERSLVITRACVGIEGWTFVLTQFIKNYSTLPELQSTQLVSPLHYPPLRGRQAQYLT
jgi:hypothetical protein